MAADWTVEISLAADGTYRGKLFRVPFDVGGPGLDPIEEVYGRDSIPAVLLALAEGITQKALREFNPRSS